MKFDVVVIDPSWNYGRTQGPNSGAHLHYGQAKLTWAQVRAIRKRYAEYFINHGRKWRDVC